MSEFSASPKKILPIGLSKTSDIDCFLYECTAEGGAIVNSILLFNNSSQEQLIQIYLKDALDGSSSAQYYEQIFEETLDAKRTYIFKGPIVTNNGDLIGFKSVSDDVINVFLFGSELFAV